MSDEELPDVLTDHDVFGAAARAVAAAQERANKAEARAARLALALTRAVDVGQKHYRGRGCPFCADRLVGGGCADDCPRSVALAGAEEGKADA